MSRSPSIRLCLCMTRRIDGDLDIWEGEYTYRCILTNDYKSSARDKMCIRDRVIDMMLILKQPYRSSVTRHINLMSATL